MKPSTAVTEPARSTFLLRDEARAWIVAAETEVTDAAARAVALDVLAREHNRPARLLLGLAASVALTVSTLVSLCIVTVLAPYWEGESGAILGTAVFVGLTVAVTSVVLLLLLQRSGRRITRAIERRGRSAVPTDDPDGQTDAFDARDAVFGRAAFLTASGVAIAFTAWSVFSMGRAEGGSFVLPFTVTTIVQLPAWIGVCVGVRRVVRAHRASVAS